MKNLTIENLTIACKELGLTKGSVAYKKIAYAIENNQSYINPCAIKGSGKFSRKLDFTKVICEVLCSMKIGLVIETKLGSVKVITIK